MTMRIMISDKMSPEGLAHFTGHEGFEVIYNPDITMEELGESIGEYDALVIRSRTQVTAEMLRTPGKLKVVGRAGAGVDNVDIEAATRKGVIVMNTPGGNTVSTAEHAISMMLALARRVPLADRTMKEGKWEKKSIVGVEMFNKTLGVLGMGKIGRVVAERMKGFGMKILAFDPFLTQDQAVKLGVTEADLDTICEQADIITIHAPLNNDTRGMINRERLAKMKPTMLLVNCARGGIVDEEALLEFLKEKKIAGAAFDVFEQEPLPADHPFRRLDNMVLTPHLAASTTEAQEKVAEAIAEQIRDALTGGMVRNAVNAPSVDPQTYARIKGALDLCERLGAFCGQFVTNAVKELQIIYTGTKAQHPSEPLTNALIKGFLRNSVSEPINDVNARPTAQQLGIKISETRTKEAGEVFSGLVTVRMTTDADETHEVSGTLNQQREPRIAIVDGKRVDAYPGGEMLVMENRDIPGVVGAVCTTLGNHMINIASMDWGRVKPGGDAFTVINIDQPISPEVLAELQALPNIIMARHLTI